MIKPKTQVLLKLDPGLAKRFKTKCRSEGRTLNGTARVLIERWLRGEVKI